MKTLIGALIGQCRNARVAAIALLVAGATGGWAMSVAANAATFDGQSRGEVAHRADTKRLLPVEEAKLGLVGSYTVSGSDPDGRPYAASGVVDVSLAPSGALELEWDNGRQVGVGEIIGDTLVVSCWSKGRTAILIMNINPDGSLSGKWTRRADRGVKGTEAWKKA